MKALGYIYYSIATENVDKPNNDLIPSDLKQLDTSKQQLAFELVSLLLMQPSDNSPISASQLQRHLKTLSKL